MIITVGGQKGGTGKTTIAVELALALAAKGSVLFVDADAQSSSTDFFAARRNADIDGNYTCVSLEGKGVMTEVQKLSPKYDWTVIDAGGYDSSGQRYAMGISDLYLAVFKPESLALWTVDNVAEMVDQAKAFNHDLKAFSLLNMGWPSGSENKESATFLQENEHIDFCPHIVLRRKAFCDATGNGISVRERKPLNEKAINEIDAVINFITSELEK